MVTYENIIVGSMSLTWLPNVKPFKEMTKWNVSKVDSNQI
jgi:hypothetical protein